MRGVVAALTLSACGLEPGGIVLDATMPDVGFDAPIDAVVDVTVEAAQDAAADAPPADTGVDSGLADTGADTGCMICPCATEADCPAPNDVCLLFVCTPCGIPATDNLRCKDGNTCHQPSSMCK